MVRARRWSGTAGLATALALAVSAPGCVAMAVPGLGIRWSFYPEVGIYHDNHVGLFWFLGPKDHWGSSEAPPHGVALGPGHHLEGHGDRPWDAAPHRVARRPGERQDLR